jgi:hypothetical protein
MIKYFHYSILFKRKVKVTYGDNVHDMDENNIPEYHADPTVEGAVIAVG